MEDNTEYWGVAGFLALALLSASSPGLSAGLAIGAGLCMVAGAIKQVGTPRIVMQQPREEPTEPPRD